MKFLVFVMLMLLAGCEVATPFNQQEASQVDRQSSQQAPRSSAQEEASSDSSPEPLVRLGTIVDGQISESSGLARCLGAEGAYWTHNDSGHAPQVFLIGATGELLSTSTISTATNRDWEAMSSARLHGAGYVIIAEVGDNRRQHLSYRLYLMRENISDELKARISGENERVEETRECTAARFEFTYEDGPHNCEAIAYDAEEKKIWLAEKVYVDDQRAAQPGIYCINFDPSEDDLNATTGGSNVLPQARRVADFPVRNVTGMSISPDGRRMLIRSYLAAYLYTRPDGRTWTEVLQKDRPVNITLPIQRQGEAVCFAADSSNIILTSEMTRQPVWQVNLDAQLEQQSGALEQAEPVPGDEPVDERSDDDG